MVYDRINLGNPSVCTWAKANNCTVPATSVTLASVFHRASVFGEEGANARLESWDPEFIVYLLCSLRRQTRNCEIKCNLSAQRQVHQFDPIPEVTQWRLDIFNFSKSMALFTEHATWYQAYCCLYFFTDANTPFHTVQTLFVTTMFTVFLQSTRRPFFWFFSIFLKKKIVMRHHPSFSCYETPHKHLLLTLHLKWYLILIYWIH